MNTETRCSARKGAAPKRESRNRAAPPGASVQAAMARLAGAHLLSDVGRADLGAAKSAEKKDENQEAVNVAGARRVATQARRGRGLREADRLASGNVHPAGKWFV